MIPYNKKQHLGGTAFIILLLRGLLPAIILIILMIIIIPIQNFLTNNPDFYSSYTSSSTNSAQLPYDIFSGIISLLPSLTIIFFIFGLIISILRYKTYSFTFEEFDLHMRRGIFHLKQNSVPYRQIQNVFTERPLIYRLLGLSKIFILSAGEREIGQKGSNQIVLEPIDYDIAEEIRDSLERKIGVQIVKQEREADDDIKM